MAILRGKKVFKNFKKSQHGNVGTLFALSLTAIMACVGAALDYSRVVKTKQYYQDMADIAALSAARVMSDTANQDIRFRKRKNLAKATANTFISEKGSEANNASLEFTGISFPKENGENTSTEVRLKGFIQPAVMQFFGYQRLEFDVSARASFAESIRPNIDIAMVADATFSMANVLRAIQDNMLKFQDDLEKELEARDVIAGDLRLKFVFFRDYMVDNHPDWTGPNMTPTTQTTEYGAMYSSKFFDVPAENAQIKNYIDNFAPAGGGDYEESAYEAIWYALNDSDWSDGAENVRSIILWTDAPIREFNNFEEITLEYYETTKYWYNYYSENLGESFWDMSDAQRQKYMVDNFYPKDAPKSLSQLKAMYDTFHEENSGGAGAVNSMSINILDNCSDVPCEGWPNIASWKGVDYNFDTRTVDLDVSQTDINRIYAGIVRQVADMVEEQAKVKKLALTD